MEKQNERKKETKEERRIRRIRSNPFKLYSDAEELYSGNRIKVCIDDYDTTALIILRRGSRIVIKSIMDYYLYECSLQRNEKDYIELKVNRVITDYDPKKLRNYIY